MVVGASVSKSTVLGDALLLRGQHTLDRMHALRYPTLLVTCSCNSVTCAYAAWHGTRSCYNTAPDSCLPVPSSFTAAVTPRPETVAAHHVPSLHPAPPQP
jgi:hypothetical protein